MVVYLAMLPYKRLQVLSEAGRDIAQVIEFEQKLFVLKKTKRRIVESEKRFQQLLAQINLPHLQVYSQPWVGPDELLLEYSQNAETMDTKRSPLHAEIWGNTVRQLHQQQQSYPEKVTDTGTLAQYSWAEYSKEIIAGALQKARPYLSRDVYAQVEWQVSESALTCSPVKFGVIHGDMHSNNVLLQRDSVILFDKSDKVWSGSPYEDLATVVLEYPNGFLLTTLDLDYQQDTELREAFFAGYGEYNKEQLLPWVLLKICDSYENTHVKYQEEMIEGVLQLF